MNGFKKLLLRAQLGDKKAVEEIVRMYWGLVVKESMVDGCYDDDLAQTLNLAILQSIKNFKIQ